MIFLTNYKRYVFRLCNAFLHLTILFTAASHTLFFAFKQYQSAFDEQKSKDRKKNLNDDKDKTVKEQLNKIASEKQRAETALGSATKTINDLRAQKERLQAELARARQEAKDARVDRDHALQAAALSLQQASAMGANGGIPGFDHEWSMIAQLKQQLEEETKKLELERAGASKAREQVRVALSPYFFC